jgi:hypothetical protein
MDRSFEACELIGESESKIARLPQIELDSETRYRIVAAAIVGTCTRHIQLLVRLLGQLLASRVEAAS